MKRIGNVVLQRTALWLGMDYDEKHLNELKAVFAALLGSWGAAYLMAFLKTWGAW